MTGKRGASSCESHPRCRPLHEVVQEVFVSILVARHLHLVLGEHVVVHVLLPPLELLSFLGQFGVCLFLLKAIVVSITIHTHAIRMTMCFPMEYRPTFSCCAIRSTFLNSLSRSSFSCLKSGCFSTLVLFKRLTIAFSRWLT